MLNEKPVFPGQKIDTFNSTMFIFPNRLLNSTLWSRNNHIMRMNLVPWVFKSFSGSIFCFFLEFLEITSSGIFQPFRLSFLQLAQNQLQMFGSVRKMVDLSMNSSHEISYFRLTYRIWSEWGTFYGFCVRSYRTIWVFETPFKLWALIVNWARFTKWTLIKSSNILISVQFQSQKKSNA